MGILDIMEDDGICATSYDTAIGSAASSLQEKNALQLSLELILLHACPAQTHSLTMCLGGNRCRVLDHLQFLRGFEHTHLMRNEIGVVQRPRQFHPFRIEHLVELRIATQFVIHVFCFIKTFFHYLREFIYGLSL